MTVKSLLKYLIAIFIMYCVISSFGSCVETAMGYTFTSSIDITISGDEIILSTSHDEILSNCKYIPTPSLPILDTPSLDKTVKIVKKTAPKQSSQSLRKSKYLKDCGIFQLTAYEWTGNPCANGKYPTRNHTVAAHKSDFPLGTVLYIEGYGTYVVEDRGGFPKGTIDIYIGNVKECFKFGRRKARVYVVSYPKKKSK